MKTKFFALLILLTLSSAHAFADCTTDPYLSGCEGSEAYCQLNPYASTCSGSEAYCHLNPYASTCTQ